jgi:hypothetical protein
MMKHQSPGDVIRANFRNAVFLKRATSENGYCPIIANTQTLFIEKQITVCL